MFLHSFPSELSVAFFVVSNSLCRFSELVILAMVPISNGFRCTLGPFDFRLFSCISLFTLVARAINCFVAGRFKKLFSFVSIYLVSEKRGFSERYQWSVGMHAGGPFFYSLPNLSRSYIYS